MFKAEKKNERGKLQFLWHYEHDREKSVSVTLGFVSIGLAVPNYCLMLVKAQYFYYAKPWNGHLVCVNET